MIWLQELQETDFEAQKLRQQGRKDYKKVYGVLHHQGLPFVPKAIQIELISCHYNNVLKCHFGIKKAGSYWLENTIGQPSGTTLRPTSRAMTCVWHQKQWGISFMIIFNLYCYSLIDGKTYWWILWTAYQSTDWKRDSYNSIRVIVDRLTKMVYYKLVKIIINTPGFAEVIIDVVIWHNSLLDSIVTNKCSLFTSKFWLSLCYFLDIKCYLSTAFYPQTDGQVKWQNSTMEAYL